MTEHVAELVHDVLGRLELSTGHVEGNGHVHICQEQLVVEFYAR